jgi:hypothetical protein
MEFPLAIEQLAPGGFQSLLTKRTVACRKRHFHRVRLFLVDSEDGLIFPRFGTK